MPEREKPHGAMNVAVHSKSASAWCLTERRIEAVHRSPDGVPLGRSWMRWEGSRLIIEFDERTAPFGRRLQGTVVLEPDVPPCPELAIDAAGGHRWWPVAPLARIDVALRQPDLCFSGHGYDDANAGSASLDSAFAEWSWLRARTSEGAVVADDATGLDGTACSHALRVSVGEGVELLEGLVPSPLETTLWRISRQTRVDDGYSARVVRSLEDGPFYARAGRDAYRM